MTEGLSKAAADALAPLGHTYAAHVFKAAPRRGPQPPHASRGHFGTLQLAAQQLFTGVVLRCPSLSAAEALCQLAAPRAFRLLLELRRER